MDVQHKDATIANTSDDGPGSFEVILSTNAKDRDGDELQAQDWKQPLPEHITFDADHGMSVATTVGSGAPEIDDDGRLIVRGTYSSLPRAQEVRTLVNEGHIRTTSVAFMTEKSKQKDGTTKQVRELLNGAFVAIPSNRDALVLSSKSAMKAGARNSKLDAQHLQAAHDSTVQAGAQCAPADDSGAAQGATGGKSLSTPAEVKSIVGSLEAQQDRARDALQDADPGRRCWLRGVLPSVLVFDIFDESSYETETFQQGYEDDGSVMTLLGAPSRVDVMEVVVADADEKDLAANVELKSRVLAMLADVGSCE